MTKYKFILPIGDWSSDGHGGCERYVVESNTPPELLVEPYLEACNKFGINNLCSEYEQDSIDEKTLQELKNFGFDVDELEDYVDPEDLAKLVLDAIMKIDPIIKLYIVPKDDLPEFNNWFALKVKKLDSGGVLSLPGYGLFE